MSRPVSSDVIGIVVSYHPDLDLLEELLDALMPQVSSVVIIDNGSCVDLHAWSKLRNDGRLKIIRLESNHGGAAAQNVGIKWAREQGSRGSSAHC